MKRKSIETATLEKVREFLIKQTDPIYISDIVNEVHVNRDSAVFALTLISHKVGKDGKIIIKKAERRAK